MENLQSFDIQTGEMLLINKDLQWTSFDVVNKIRIIIRKTMNLPKIKAGHAGTLDPLATGLMLVGVGKATKRLHEFQSLPKIYEALLHFGATTPSHDLETEITETFEFRHITKEQLETVLAQKFTGKIMQTPPTFSAKKIDGRRAYKSARKGIKLEIEPVEINIENVEIISFNLPCVKLKINCSKGTYIRSLAYDIGLALESGAYLAELKRTSIGDFSLNQALTLTQFEEQLKQLISNEAKTL